MDEPFYSLVNVEEVADSSQLTIPRAVAVYAAASKHSGYRVVRLLRHVDGNNTVMECVVVDVECDSVPSHNLHGIAYCERLALCVPANPKALVDVLALRKAFPILLHQNRVVPDSPASLCLYFEPTLSVLRTWTPENFLRRIQWWLEKTARDELHPADQPVEQLFFVTKYELVLPWNFAALQRTAGQRFRIWRGPERPDGTATFFIGEAAKDGAAGRGIVPVEVTSPPVLHGQVEQDPATLGQLMDLLQVRGIDVLTTLKATIQEGVGTAGTPAKSDESFSVILLHVPMQRSSEAGPERIALRAFLLQSGALRLGEALGALFMHNGTYFREMSGALAPVQKNDWRNERLFSMEVLRYNDAAAARTQSGITDDGPAGVLVGAGALGSAMLNLWGRSGWGRWTAIDKDHVKPHNLSRHAAYAQHVGIPKSDVAAELHAAVMDGANEVTSLCADACNLDQDAVANALRRASLVVDASTTLEYPRLVSNSDQVGRHLSVFLTPNGNGAVMLAEDERRAVRLRTLEAQYYRAVINEPWGANHLDGNLGTFWSGASCRDISVVLPYSRIVTHAATLAEQVQLAWARQDPLIRVWVRDPASGSVASHEMPVHPEQRLKVGNFDFFFDDGVEQKLRDLRARFAPHETGGVLLGYYDFNVNAIVLVDVLPAPTDSAATAVSFERGVNGLPAAVEEAARRTAGNVQYIGEWHSHPPGQSSSPSRDDLFQLAYLTHAMAQDGLPAVSLIVGERDIRVLQGTALG